MEAKKKSWFQRHWILAVILGLFILGVIGNSSTKNSSFTDYNKLAKFESEVAQIGNSLTTYKVINRNNYSWHNVEITVNDHYSCWSREILESEDSITINAVTCNQFVINYDMIKSIDVKADEGTERYSLT